MKWFFGTTNDMMKSKNIKTPMPMRIATVNMELSTNCRKTRAYYCDIVWTLADRKEKEKVLNPKDSVEDAKVGRRSVEKGKSKTLFLNSNEGYIGGYVKMQGKNSW